MYKNFIIKRIGILLIMVLTLILGSCSRRGESRFRDVDSFKPERITNLERIRERGVLKVVTEFNSMSYFIYRGQPMGFQYDMLQELANFMDLRLEVNVSNNLEQNFRDLLDGEVDLIAMNLTVTYERTKTTAQVGGVAGKPG